MALRKPIVIASTGELQQLQAADTLDVTLTESQTTGLVADLAARVQRKASLATNKSIANTLTQVVGFTAASAALAVGTTIRFRGIGLLTNTTSASTSVITLRINSASLGATIEASWTCALGTTARTNCPFTVEGEIIVISTGAGGTAWGCLLVNCNTTTALAVPTTMVTAAVTCITTQSNVVEMTCISGASTTTWNFISATVDQVT
jgi:hypothetical protein